MGYTTTKTRTIKHPYSAIAENVFKLNVSDIHGYHLKREECA